MTFRLLNRYRKGDGSSRDVISADDCRDHRDPGGPGSNDLSDVTQANATDAHDREREPGPQLSNRVAANRLAPGRFRGCREDRPDAEIIGPLFCGPEGLFNGVSRNPQDLACPQERAGLPWRQVILSKVDTVGIGRERQIEPVIHNEGNPVLSTQLGNLASLVQKLTRSGCLVPKLDHRCATFYGLHRYFNVA